MNPMHIIEAQQFKKSNMQEIFMAADRIRERVERRLPVDLLQGKILANLFFVPSMRTRISFELAMKRLGGEVVNIDGNEAFSSELAGGTFEDTVQVIGSLTDVIVLRHHQSGSAKRAAEASPVPIINGGDGPAQHPTQALIDLYCIEKLKGGIDGNSIAFIGDLKHSRTIRSLVYFLAKYSGIKIFFASPGILRMGEDLKEYLAKIRVPFKETWDDPDQLREIVSRADLLYLTQIPKEPFVEQREDYEQAKEIYRIHPALLEASKKDTAIMHPLPRGGELPAEIDKDPRATYFRAMQWGQFLRMGLLCYVLRVPID